MKGKEYLVPLMNFSEADQVLAHTEPDRLAEEALNWFVK